MLDVLGESLLLVRTPAGALRAFYNVCRHRGTRLCRDPADPAAPTPLPGGIAAGRITCPYHQWTYDFDGRLVERAAPSRRAGLRQETHSACTRRRSTAGVASCS